MSNKLQSQAERSNDVNQLLDAKMASFLNARRKMKASLNKSNQMNNKINNLEVWTSALW